MELKFRNLHILPPAFLQLFYKGWELTTCIQLNHSMHTITHNMQATYSQHGFIVSKSKIRSASNAINWNLCTRLEFVHSSCSFSTAFPQLFHSFSTAFLQLFCSCPEAFPNRISNILEDVVQEEVFFNNILLLLRRMKKEGCG